MKIQLTHTFEEITSVENLLDAWKEFLRSKRTKRDVQEFQLYLMDNIFALHGDLVNKVYRHGGYHEFHIFDPKPRIIHKASVCDRLLHHAIYRKLYPFFDRTFIADSYSCRNEKGTHKALNRFRQFGYIVSRNDTRTCWVLKCDIRKFFANIDHPTLLNILRRYIPDKNVMWLLEEVIKSFASSKTHVGLPLGNLTSQLFVNIYMNEFDQFVKHQLKVHYYIRYADDFALLSEDRKILENFLLLIKTFLREKLKLALHPQKVSIETLASGINFLGWVHFPDHRTLRTTTKKRMIKKVVETQKEETLNSYLGLLIHGNAYALREMVLGRCVMLEASKELSPGAEVF